MSVEGQYQDQTVSLADDDDLKPIDLVYDDEDMQKVDEPPAAQTESGPYDVVRVLT